MLGENPMAHHWKAECIRFEEELARWKEFRDYQPDMVHRPLLRTTFDPKCTDQQLIKILVRLNDWREFQFYYQRVKVGHALSGTWQSKWDMKHIMDEEPISQESTSSLETAIRLENCYQKAFKPQLDLKTFKKQLTWIESQILEIVAESCASLEAYPLVQQQFETKLEQQTNAFMQELESLEARPVRPVQPAHKSALCSQRVRYWALETTRLMQEHEHWSIFRKWRKKHPSTEEIANVAEQKSSEPLSHLQIWVDYVSYRQYQLDRCRHWVADLQLLLKIRENEMKTTPRNQLWMLEIANSKLQDDVRNFEHEVYTAELHVRSAEEQLAELSLQRFSPATIQMTRQIDRHTQLPLSPPKPESIKNVSESSNLALSSSSPTKVDRTSISTKSPIIGIPNSVQPSSFPSKAREVPAEWIHTNNKEPVIVPNHVIAFNDVQTIEAHGSPRPGEAIRDGEGAEVIDSPKSDVPKSDDEDIFMTDVEYPMNTCSRIASEANSKGRDTRVSRSSPLPIHQVPIPKKTRSAKKLDQVISSRVLKSAVKKPVRKAKAFTDQQTTALLSHTLVESPRTDSRPMRRSQRLMEKATAPSLTSLPQVNAAESSQSSRQKKPGKQLKSVGPSHSPRKEKPKLQPRAVKAPQTSRQRKSKMPSNAVEPSLSSR